MKPATNVWGGKPYRWFRRLAPGLRGQLYRANASPLVASAAQFVFPPEDLDAPAV